MIYESSYWKDDLLRQAKSLQRRVVQRQWREASFACLEQTIMLGFYSIRKLIEAKKLTDKVANQKLRLKAYPWLGKPVTKKNWDKYWELYDLNARSTITQDLLSLCHQFVHSYVFAASFDESSKLDGFLVSSDRERHKQLYFIPVQEVIRIFMQVGRDYPALTTWTFNSGKQDYDITNN